jgi:hypothetical protein
MSRVTGSLITVERQTGRIYFMKVRDRNGRQIKRRLGPVAEYTRKQAQDALRDWLTDLGRSPGQGDRGVTFVAAARAYLHYIEHEKDRPRAPSTLRDYRSTISHHLGPRFPGTLAEIGVDDIARYRRELLASGADPAARDPQARAARRMDDDQPRRRSRADHTPPPR